MYPADGSGVSAARSQSGKVFHGRCFHQVNCQMSGRVVDEVALRFLAEKIVSPSFIAVFFGPGYTRLRVGVLTRLSAERQLTG